MKASETGQILTAGLRLSGVSRGTQATVYVMMETDEQKMKMCEFLSINRDVTDVQILDEARRIAEEA